MQLPGRLRSTTLGDLLGSLHRAEATGTLELVEDRGRVHRVFLSGGRVTAVELDGSSSMLAELLHHEGYLDEPTLRRAVLRAMASRRMMGEVLVRDFALSSEVVGAALRKQLVARLCVLEQLGDARVSFRVTLRPPRSALVDTPLEAAEFLRGRRRRRETRPSEGSPSAHEAHRVLGIPRDADAAEIKRAFRRLARQLHPDLHPDASDAERRALGARFAIVAAAYQSLVA